MHAACKPASEVLVSRRTKYYVRTEGLIRRYGATGNSLFGKILGAGEIAAGAALTATGAGAPVGVPLMAGGAGTEAQAWQSGKKKK